MKGKDTFTSAEIIKLEELIVLRNKTPSSGQKAIRGKMRKIGFYGQDDWGITNLQIAGLRSLIKSGRIKVIGENLKSTSSVKTGIKVPQTVVAKPILNTNIENDSTELEPILDLFKINRFDPQVDSEIKLPNCPGNYILCLRGYTNLPNVSISPVLKKFEEMNVIYTGIASGSLRTRNYKHHFKGNNAGRSTLRKSLGVLFGYNQIPRDKDPNSVKTKFINQDELKLTAWMQMNLIMFVLSTSDFNSIELKLINRFNPPLNLKDNHNSVNSDFRRLLSNLRRSKNS